MGYIFLTTISQFFQFCFYPKTQDFKSILERLNGCQNTNTLVLYRKILFILAFSAIVIINMCGKSLNSISKRIYSFVIYSVVVTELISIYNSLLPPLTIYRFAVSYSGSHSTGLCRICNRIPINGKRASVHLKRYYCLLFLDDFRSHLTVRDKRIHLNATRPYIRSISTAIDFFHSGINFTNREFFRCLCLHSKTEKSNCVRIVL